MDTTQWERTLGKPPSCPHPGIRQQGRGGMEFKTSFRVPPGNEPTPCCRVPPLHPTKVTTCTAPRQATSGYRDTKGFARAREQPRPGRHEGPSIFAITASQRMYGGGENQRITPQSHSPSRISSGYRGKHFAGPTCSRVFVRGGGRCTRSSSVSTALHTPSSGSEGPPARHLRRLLQGVR